MRVTLLLALIACDREAPREVATPPSVELSITTDLPGASAATVETSVTAPLEQALGHVERVEHITSRSTRDRSVITLSFPAATPDGAAQQAVLAALARTLPQLPASLPAPPATAPLTSPVVASRITLASRTIPLGTITTFANQLSATLAVVPGVGRVSLCGDRLPQYEIRVDAEKLGANTLTVQQLADELGAPGADLEHPDSVPLVARVAAIVRADSVPTCRAFAQGAEVVGVSVRPLAGTNPADLRPRLDAVVADLKRQLSPGVELATTTEPAAELVALPSATGVPALAQKLSAHSPMVELDGDTLRAVGAVATPLSLTKLGPTVHTIGLQGADREALRTAQLALFRAPTLRVVGLIGKPAAGTVGNETEPPAPEYVVDAERAATLGVTVDPATMSALAPGGFAVPSRTLPVRIVIVAPDRGAALSQIHFGAVPLAAIASVRQASGPEAILHRDRVPWLGLYVAGTRAELDAALAKLPVPPGIERTVQ